jgi:hypothetical protein
MDDLNKLWQLNGKIYRLTNNYLERQGWFLNVPADSEGYTPWFTYPAVSFLKDIISPEVKVFEFGSGYSTLYFNKNAGECFSVEHDRGWANHLLKINPAANIVVCEEGAAPLAEALNYFAEFAKENFLMPTISDRNHNIQHGLLNLEFSSYASQLTARPCGYFDIIVVDGMARLLTGYLAAQFLSENGYIILDNSDRWRYNDLQRYLIRMGFGRVDFWGVGPVNDYPWCTSFFSKQFGIKNHRVDRPAGSGELGW